MVMLREDDDVLDLTHQQTVGRNTCSGLRASALQTQWEEELRQWKRRGIGTSRYVCWRYGFSGEFLTRADGRYLLTTVCVTPGGRKADGLRAGPLLAAGIDQA